VVCFVFMYKTRTMKPVETVLKTGRGVKENNGGVNLINIYFKHMCKRHNVFNANKNIRKVCKPF
jgi:hypothetical protein